jgi:hypothetical protein
MRLTKGMHPFGEIMEILTVPIPLQPFVDRFIGTALPKRLTDPETTQRWVVTPSLVIESADPASAQIILKITPEHPVHLIDQLCCAAAVLMVSGPLEQLKEVADREGVSPKIPLRIFCSRRQAGSPGEFGHEPSRCR